ncbi:WW domain-containing oxidoreductase isoform X2 [Coccinella septempunctata]|uniref:WW domain-containing oxidoreductase isoform X2 n=1 Tax=Coccinella septempunctata TaxID=41139 RepID=UPI001D067A11|nr:WW domain-containing oxidoreductase isoform X2 [Coccinella septempunctata]
MNLPDTDSEDELPPGWEERVTVDGSVFYANHLQKATQWTHPRTDHENKRTTYTDPRLAFAVEEKENVNDYRQRFDAHTSALQILHGKDLNGKIAIVTGANTGIGFETARSLLKHGCTVIFACRNLKSAEAAIEKIREEKPIPDEKCPVFYLDLANLKTVKDFHDQVRQLKIPKIDMLILNAGVFALPFSKTIDGYETTFQVNHLSHFYLTCLFDDLLSTGSRVVVLSSESHRFSTITLDNISELKLSPETASNFWSTMAYNNSKLCNVLFARQLAKKLQNRGVSVFSVHPGNMVYSDIARYWWFYRLLFYIARPFTKSLQQAAATTIFCAVAPELNGVTGCYFNNCYQCEESKSAQKDDLALALWEISTQMVEKVMGEQRGSIFKI